MQPWIIGLSAFILVLALIALTVYRVDAIGTTTDETSAIESADATQSNEDRVMALLRDNDGQMRQRQIVSETGWSKSKVSMLLSEMDEEDHISKIRVGRENLISIAGSEPDVARSPFEDNE